MNPQTGLEWAGTRQNHDLVFGHSSIMKAVHKLVPSDLASHRVWEFADDIKAELPDETDETYMRPVEELPVDSLSGRLASVLLTLANGHRLLAILGNIDLADPVSTEQFLTLTVFHPSGERFNLARYHDVDYERRGPVALAAFLGMPLEEVFPIGYDISDIALGHADCLSRSVPAVPPSRLSKDALIELAVR